MPSIRFAFISYIFFAFPCACEVNCRTFDFFFWKCSRYLSWTFTSNCHIKYPTYNRRSFFINNPMMYIFGVFIIPVRRNTANRLSCVAPRLKRYKGFTAAISDIPLIHNIEEWRKLASSLNDAVNSVRFCDKTNAAMYGSAFHICRYCTSCQVQSAQGYSNRRLLHNQFPFLKLLSL